jgi:hypothetical protein
MRLAHKQLQAIRQQHCVEDHESLKLSIREAWIDARTRLRPLLVSAQDELLDAWIQACYEDCVRVQVDSVRDCARYSLAVLRALHLGVGQGFINGLRRHFTSRPRCAAGSLVWIEHVVQQIHLQRDVDANDALASKRPHSP